MPARMRRARLVERVATSRIVAFEAPWGAGKTTLLHELAAVHDGPVLQITLTGATTGCGELLEQLADHPQTPASGALVSALEGADLAPEPWPDGDGAVPSLVVIDEVHRADDELIHALIRVVERWPAPHRVLFAGRRLPHPLAQAVRTSDGLILGAGELRFQTEETRAALGATVADRLDATEIALLTERCAGWAAAIVHAASRLERAMADSDAAFRRETARLLGGPAALADLVDSLLEDTSVADRMAVARVAALPGVDDVIIEAAGFGGGLAALADLGLPMVGAASGLWTLPDGVREVLASGPPDRHLARFAAGRYRELDHLEAMLEVLRIAGLEDDLTGALEELLPAATGRIGLVGHGAAVRAVPPARLAAEPRILVDLADAYLVAGRLEDYRETIRRARSLIDGRGDEPPDAGALEVIAAELVMRAVAGDHAVIADLERLLTRSELPPMARARVLGGVARATARRGTASALRLAGRQLEEAEQLYLHAGASIYVATIRIIAATYVNGPLGNYQEALHQLNLVLETADRGARVSALPYRAFILIDLGRYAEAQADLAELRHTAAEIDGVRNDRSAASARWGAAKIASQQGDPDATWAACHAVERSELVVDAGHGALFRADAAQLLARVGRLDEAERFLAAARARDPGRSVAVTVSELAVAAHTGDLRRVEAMLAELDGGGAVEPRDRWRVTLLHAYARHLAGAGDVRSLAAAAFEEAAQLGVPRLPLIREADVARTLLPLAMESSASARDLARLSPTRIRVLGGLDIERDGRTVEPSGRPGELLAFLVLHGGSCSIEEAVEALWPDSEPSRGRERLRTVLHRIRREHGDLVDRHDDRLRFEPSVTVDAEEFLAFARQAQEPGGDHTSAAGAALALYRGAAVPELAYQSWAIDGRHRLERQALTMLTLVATAAETDGRLDDAIRAHRRAIELDPVAEPHHLAVSRLLAEQGHRARALQVLADATSILIAEGLHPSDELIRLEAYLRRGPATAVAASDPS